MRIALAAIVAATVMAATAPIVAQAQTFDGITIIELDDNLGATTIVNKTGTPTGKHIITFVSAAGTYASVADGCVAWAQDGSYTGTSITFGVPRDEQTGGTFPPICEPFTLSIEGSDRVRVEAGATYSRARKVVARVPFVAFDWGQPHFARHDIEGLTLGPVPVMQAKFAATADIQINPRQLANGAIYEKNMRVTIPNPNDQANPATVNGRILAAEPIGWPWDAIVGTTKSERLLQKSLVDVFDKAVVERYGPAGLREAGLAPPGVRFSWFYDLAGRPVDVGNLNDPNNCFATRDLWRKASADSDIGPWGCSLVFSVTHDGTRDFVSRFEVAADSGYPRALSHFARRLNELQAVREKIDAVRSAPVDF